MNLTSLGLTPLDKLKCASCHNYLSFFPVRVGSNLQNICGRCPSPDGSFFHNVAYEAVSEWFVFPCRYQYLGCEEEFQPKAMPLHEEDCKFRVILCPTKKWTGCDRPMIRSEALHHCENEHGDLFTNEFIMDLSRSKQSFSLIRHEGLLLIMTRQFEIEQKVLRFELYTSQFEKKGIYSCQLSVNCGNKGLSFDFVSTDFESVKSNELCLESVLNNLEDQSANVKISVGKTVTEVINLDMLSVLKCFVCSEYAIPPIFHCVVNSETLCEDCNKTHSRSCPNCLQAANTRNINLDKMAHRLNYPCKFRKNGCPNVAKPEQIANHQKNCNLADFHCPINEFDPCPWKGLLDELEGHIQNAHQELVTNSSQLSKRLIPNRMKCDIVKFCNQLFRLVCLKTPEEKYLWSVQTIGTPKYPFLYEIEVVAAVNKNLRLLVRQPCAELTTKGEIFKNGDFCYFVEQQMRDFVVDQVVTFKIRILM